MTDTEKIELSIFRTIDKLRNTSSRFDNVCEAFVILARQIRADEIERQTASSSRSTVDRGWMSLDSERE